MALAWRMSTRYTAWCSVENAGYTTVWPDEADRVQRRKSRDDRLPLTTVILASFAVYIGSPPLPEALWVRVLVKDCVGLNPSAKLLKCMVLAQIS